MFLKQALPVRFSREGFRSDIFHFQEAHRGKCVVTTDFMLYIYFILFLSFLILSLNEWVLYPSFKDYMNMKLANN